MYRIIAGKWKAKKISAPKNFDVRPTTDFAKEALFSILQNKFEFEFCSVLDLFCGIGSVSLEFASRDCQDITSVDSNSKHTGFISSTAADLEMALQIRTMRADVFEFIRKNKTQKTYDIIFADPPFETEQNKYEELIKGIFENDFLKENGLFVLEHQSKMKFENENLQDTRKYGNVSFSFFKINK
ncbi:16S rRNA (guanine(966)-N(2))-methyltransferase RsmD [Halpernia humi]|uniref:16S rRNA (Guanine(966)-N(2))-methyltransferase RsmD n=1 Tax=Halpernia humi TaxID=493375 RepID=A0A1H5UBX4_9FLAO|nr:16S rRNA (guanine(966)-N(2))-methyltransferase RsmD [Halpernia humi]SEF72615.1 16S rRNA (guanine(966)-N(2))-methyltransferase RsmD [Halpernia humi]